MTIAFKKKEKKNLFPPAASRVCFLRANPFGCRLKKLKCQRRFHIKSTSVASFHLQTAVSKLHQKPENTLVHVCPRSLERTVLPSLRTPTKQSFARHIFYFYSTGFLSQNKNRTQAEKQKRKINTRNNFLEQRRLKKALSRKKIKNS